MDADRELFRLSETGMSGARVYGWNHICVSLGVSQTAGRALTSTLIPWVRRPTGGKGVLHGHDITIGMAMTFEDLDILPQHFRSVSAVYRKVVRILIESLNNCGFETALGEDVGPRILMKNSSDCFAHVAPNDLIQINTGLKVCGCALRLGLRSVLVQASIPICEPEVDPRDIFQNASVSTHIQLCDRQFAEELESEINRTRNYNHV